MKLGKRLAELRKKNHYKQSDLVERLNVSQQVISNIERDKTEPDIEFLKGVADLYNLSLDQLIGRDFMPVESDDELERQIICYIKQMNDKERKLSLGLVSQVAQHRGSSDGNE